MSIKAFDFYRTPRLVFDRRVKELGPDRSPLRFRVLVVTGTDSLDLTDN